jgi:hypothetical protein
MAAADRPDLRPSGRRYSFRRNVWGLRPYGLSASLLGLIAALVAAMVIRKAAPAFFLVAAVTSNMLFLLFWWKTVTEAWVRRPAEAYAHALLASLDRAALGQDSSTEHE